ncbi:MAG: hypothetical protein KatS3mg026_1794 [Bacteroidia bacterium]|nr:MAG: hypothetical protein KatS3mg026_1794 [Bacteroidia bacterium]
MLEAQDIGGGTSTTSTKLVHGGVRYLESAVKNFRYADWKLVREALRERAWMLQSHPQLAKPLPIVVPVRTSWERLYYGVGLKLYELLSPSSYKLGPTHWLASKALYSFFPAAKAGFRGGWQYWDGQFEDRLYAVHLALFLRQRYGVEVRTYARVTAMRLVKGHVRVEVETPLGLRYEEEGDWLVNATGPWSDRVRRLIRPEAPARLRLSRGSHLVVPRSALPIQAGFLIPRTEDGRLLFVLPWKDETVLVGTTEVEEGQPTWKVPVSEEEEAYLRAYVAQYFEVEEPLPVQARFAGYRPLVRAGRGPSARLARSHVVEVWPQLRTVKPPRGQMDHLPSHGGRHCPGYSFGFGAAFAGWRSSREHCTGLVGARGVMPGLSPACGAGRIVLRGRGTVLAAVRMGPLPPRCGGRAVAAASD